MKILGIDPGLRNTGWAILRVNGQIFEQLGAGTVHSDSKATLNLRLLQIFEELEEVIAQYCPDEAAVEEVFVNKDAMGTLKLGQARAMALLAPTRAGLDVAEYAPNQVKKAVVGKGHADKSQVEYMVKLQVKDFQPVSADATDAMAIALCHSFLRRTKIANIKGMVA